MELCYRGVTYNYNQTSVKTIEGEVGGKYRGIPWRYTRVQIERRLNEPTFDLYYRGVSPKRVKASEPSGIPAMGNNI